ncbi:MAG: hypothetical protein V3575_05500 [Candidatus Absconditabacteria bacterium]
MKKLLGLLVILSGISFSFGLSIDATGSTCTQSGNWVRCLCQQPKCEINVSKFIGFVGANAQCTDKNSSLAGSGVEIDLSVNGKNKVANRTCYTNILSWEYDYSDCKVQGTWSNNEINCVQTIENLRPVYGYSLTKQPDFTKPINNIVTLKIQEDFNGNCTDKKANNSDLCTISYIVKEGNNSIKGNKGIIWNGKNTITSLNLGNHCLNSVDNINCGLNKRLNIKTESLNNGKTINFKITSIVPASINKISFNLGGDKVFFNNKVYSFLKLFKGELSGLSSEGKNSTIKIGNSQLIGLKLIDENGLGLSPQITNYKESLTGKDKDYVVLDKIDSGTINGYISIRGNINYVGTGLIGNTILKTDPKISYNLNGNSIKYPLTSSLNPNDNESIFSDDATLKGVKVIGLSQSVGKQMLTDYSLVNISEISKSQIKSTISKNISTLLRGIKDGTLEKGIIQYRGNQLLSKINLNGVNLLIINGGDLTIDVDINKNLGIVCLDKDKDIYNDNGGNIIINNNVKFINASIYGDGGLIGKGGEDQLVIKGQVITSNTIGGAIKGSSGTYILPGGKATTDHNLALKYDLNYLRNGNENFNTNKNQGFDNYPLVIIYEKSDIFSK